MKHSLRVRRGLIAGTLAAATAGVLALAVPGAHASPTPVGARGMSTITLGGKAINQIEAGCGLLSATAANGATATTTATNQLRLTFPISGLEFNTDGNGNQAFKIDHSGQVTVSNACYTITFTNVKIDNFGTAGQIVYLDFTAVQHSGDDNGRALEGTLDLTEAQVTIVNQNQTRITKMNLLLAGEGAEELNELTTGSFFGPFYAGEKVGNAKTNVIFTY